jgi:crotonobetainyl-CoA:carnitine CoA-transferase CaiB-like acyl-CoA transferase
MELLQGVRVLDLTRLYPGPFCTMMMADMGAEVIKVESPGEGDYMRDMGPMGEKYSLYFRNLNRNKKSISLNLKKAEGVEIFLRLASKADVVVDGFRPGVVDTLGIGYEAVKKVNPEIVYCAISGYGQDGPYRERAGHDINYMALAGILGISGREDGPPLFPGVQVADVGGGALMALSAILAVLFARSNGRGGRYIDVSMLDGLISWLPMPVADLSAGREVGRGRAMLNGGWACYDVYRTTDGGYISLGALEPKFWAEFCRGIGKEELIERQYQKDQQALKDEVSRIIVTRTRKEWEHIFTDFDACCEPVLTLEEMVAHPQVVARELVDDYCPSFPVKIPGTERTAAAPAPLLGQHTAELLREAGFLAEEIEKLEQQGVLRTRAL